MLQNGSHQDIDLPFLNDSQLANLGETSHKINFFDQPPGLGCHHSHDEHPCTSCDFLFSHVHSNSDMECALVKIDAHIKTSFPLTFPCVLPFTTHPYVVEILPILLLLHLMSYLLDWHKVMRLSMMKTVSTQRTLPTHHHLLCCMKTTRQVSLLKLNSLMKFVTEMAAILRAILKSTTTAILKPCMIWFTSRNAIF